jgi:hypothetical protein
MLQHWLLCTCAAGHVFASQQPMQCGARSGARPVFNAASDDCNMHIMHYRSLCAAVALAALFERRDHVHSCLSYSGWPCRLVLILIPRKPESAILRLPGVALHCLQHHSRACALSTRTAMYLEQGGPRRGQAPHGHIQAGSAFTHTRCRRQHGCR